MIGPGEHAAQGVEYRAIQGWPGYLVGSDSTVWSCLSYWGEITQAWKEKKQSLVKGYRKVTLSRSAKHCGKHETKMMAVHHLVLEAFVGPRPSGMVCRWRDGNLMNNVPSNLYWGKRPKSQFAPKKGELNSQWKGDAVTPTSGRRRARGIYRLSACERCGKPAFDRHHKDGNTLNNDRGNIEILCRRCHMTVDGRLAAFVEAGTSTRGKRKPPTPCVNCGTPAKPLRKGRCNACSLYLMKHGRERVLAEIPEHYRSRKGGRKRSGQETNQ